MAGNPFVFVQGGAASSAALTLNVSNSTANGDDLVFGVSIATTPAVVRVTDTQGNTWTGSVTDTTETGEQIWTFESPGASALIGGVDQITITVTQT